jgi:hypothetical protein
LRLTIRKCVFCRKTDRQKDGNRTDGGAKIVV